MSQQYAGVTQLVEISSDTRKVSGPSPLTSTIYLCGIKPNLVRQWFAKPPVSGSPLCPFKSDVPRQLFIYGGKRDVYRSRI